MKQIFLSLIIILAYNGTTFAATGCDLNDPDRDVRRLFPGSTGYKTDYVSIDKKGGEKLLSVVEQKLGDRFSGLYETIDVPYTIYTIFRGKQKVGYIHGVNQKGKYGGIQVFLVLNMKGTIMNFYYQKLTGRSASRLRTAAFGKQFVGLSLADFMQYDPVSGKAKGRVAVIRNHAPDAENDFKATLRGVKKNLILMNVFVYGNN